MAWSLDAVDVIEENGMAAHEGARMTTEARRATATRVPRQTKPERAAPAAKPAPDRGRYAQGHAPAAAIAFAARLATAPRVDCEEQERQEMCDTPSTVVRAALP